MIHGRKDPSGRLSEVSYRPATHADDVRLGSVPTGFGPWVHDPTSPDGWRNATSEDLTVDERLGVALGLPKRLAALVVLASSDATAAQRARAQAVVDATKDAIVLRWTS